MNKGMKKRGCSDGRDVLFVFLQAFYGGYVYFFTCIRVSSSKMAVVLRRS